MPPRVLIVDDRDGYARLCHEFLRDCEYVTRCELPGPCWECPERQGCTLTHAHSWRELDEALSRAKGRVDAVLLDVAFDLPDSELLPEDKPDRSAAAMERLRRYQGIEILSRLRRKWGELPVILMTTHEDLAFEDMADRLRAEEYTYLIEGDSSDAHALRLQIARVAERGRATPESGGFFWGRSARMQDLRQKAEVLGATDRPVLVLGETGTGKSLFAEKVLHALSGRRGPFCAVDLAAIPETLVASELFGTARGAYSGATDRAGRFEHASGGTLFLDEVGNLSPTVQKALLLVLQDRRVTRLGANEPRDVDVKLVAATNDDLGARVADGTFRADLFMRLNPAASLEIPPLRERREDVDDLVRLFARRGFASGANRRLLGAYAERAGLDPAAARVDVALGEEGGGPWITFAVPKKSADELRRHSWPGNVRQLEGVVDSALAFALVDAARAPKASNEIPVSARGIRELLRAADSAPSAADRGGVSVQLRRAASLHDIARDVERQYFERLYQDTSGDFGRMAAMLLGKDDPVSARKVRLRFNQLGLRVKGRGSG